MKRALDNESFPSPVLGIVSPIDPKNFPKDHSPDDSDKDFDEKELREH